MDARNRVGLALLGLALVAAGVSVLLAATSRLLPEGTPLLLQPPRLLDATRTTFDAQPWLWAVVAVVAAAAVLLAARGIVRQLAVPRQPHLRTLRETGSRGTSTIAIDGVTDAVARDLQRVRGVVGADVVLVGLRPEPTVRARVVLAADADPQRVVDATDGPLERLRAALGASSVHRTLELDFGVRELPRVR